MARVPRPRRTSRTFTVFVASIAGATTLVLPLAGAAYGAPLAGSKPAGPALVGPAATTSTAPASTTGPNPACPWVGATASDTKRAQQVLGQMTLDEKITVVHGAGDAMYAGSTAAIPRLCIPQLKLSDGPTGIQLHNSDGNTTQLPSETSMAASFDPKVAKSYGSVIGQEGKTKGVDVSLSPTINIVRDPRWGRAFESLGEDPYLTGGMAAADVNGIQDQGVLAQVKHYALYNQETNRGGSTDNVIVDDRTVHEIYTAAFGTVVQDAHPASVMCSYSWINGTNACENSYLDSILKGEQGFDGFITSDWWGTKSTVPAALAGLDMEMPDNAHFGAALTQAVTSGVVPVSRLNDMVTRILTQEFKFGLIDKPAPRTPDADASTPAHKEAARTISEAGTVLLKNSANVLPLNTMTVKSIAVIGDGAGVNTLSSGGGSAFAQGSGTVTPFDGIKNRGQSAGVTVKYAQGYDAYGNGELPPVPSEVLTPSSGAGNGLTGQYFTNKTLTGAPAKTQDSSYLGYNWNGAAPVAAVPGSNWSARWNGTLTAPKSGSYTFGITSDDGSRLFINGVQVIDNWADQGPTTKTYQVDLTQGQRLDVKVEYYNGGGGSLLQFGWIPPGVSSDPSVQAVSLAHSSDVAIVYANLPTAEGTDLTSIDLPADQNALISKVAQANPNTIVVLNTGSAVTMPWLSQVKGVLEAWYPGQESGNAIAALLFGDVNPSGKLPVTFPASLPDVPASTPAQFPGTGGTVQYSEGLDVGYRWYDAKNLTPLYPFGYGLSYTSFKFSNLHVDGRQLSEKGTLQVTVDVTNTGSRTGAEVAQLYLSDPASTGEPASQLKGFQKVDLAPRQTKRVTFDITAKDASYWNTDAQAWTLGTGTYTARVGDSSRNLLLSDTLKVTRTSGPRYTKVTAPAEATAAGTTLPVTTTFTNGSTQPVREATTTLTVPAGWSRTATTPATHRVVPAGESFTTTWQVGVPAAAKAGAVTLTAATTYQGSRGLPSGIGTALVDIEYANLAAAFDTVAVSDDANPSVANFDGQGYSYSKQALASVGITQGQPVATGTTSFTWPNVPAGQPDAVSTNGQTIALSGTGSALSFLAAGANGNQRGQVTVTYTDGTTSTSTITVSDWWANQAIPGCTIVATTPYWNRPPNSTNPADHHVSLYAASVALTAGKQVKYMTLPSNPQLHIFASTIG